MEDGGKGGEEEVISCLGEGDHVNDLIGREEARDKSSRPPAMPLVETEFLSCLASYWGGGLAAGDCPSDYHQCPIRKLLSSVLNVLLCSSGLIFA